MKYYKILVWFIAAILITTSCKKDQQTYPSDYFIAGNQTNMLINNDTITIVIGPNSDLRDFPVDVDYDGINDFSITAGYYKFMGGSKGYQHISISTTNKDFELFGYTANDSIWHSWSNDTSYYPDYVLIGTTTIYSCIHSSPNQTIGWIKTDVIKPFCYLYGDTINTTTHTYSCDKVNLYRGAVTYYDYYKKNDTARFFTYHQLNDCFNLPLDTILYLCYVNRSKKGIKYYGWLKLYLTNDGHNLKIMERAIARR